MWFIQIVYIKQLVENCDLINCRFVFTFMKSYLFKIDIHNDELYQIIENEIQLYSEILNSCQWLIVEIKQDIAFAINKLIQFMLNFTSIH